MAVTGIMPNSSVLKLSVDSHRIASSPEDMMGLDAIAGMEVGLHAGQQQEGGHAERCTSQPEASELDGCPQEPPQMVQQGNCARASALVCMVFV